VKFTVAIAATRASILSAAIDSVRRQTHDDWELVIVGQGSDRSVRDVTTQRAADDPRIRYVHSDARGLSQGRNAAIRTARGEILAMIDDDCEADARWLEVLDGRFCADPDVGLVGGALIAPAPRRPPPRNCPSLEPAEAVYQPRSTGGGPPPGWDWLGGNFALRLDVAAEVGEFDVALGSGSVFPSCDDTDYKLRLETHGIRMRSTPAAVVRHTNGWRYGARALWTHQRNYARGNGAMAAKLTLTDDPRGEEWLRATRDLILQHPLRAPVALRRFHHFSNAYYECLTRYRVDEIKGVLRRL
jgi:glycosyltransferase involved in cell wall biosynthesis